MPFSKAVKKEAKLRLAIMGPSGSGKTMTSLILASALGDKIAVVDTESGSASKYADMFDFDVAAIDDYHVDNYIQAMADAVKGGYDVLVIDSLSHAWSGKGGVLEQVDNIAARMRKPDTFSAWKDGGKMHQKLINAIISVPIHVVCTMRTKTTYVREKDERGKTEIRNVGLQPVQRDDVEYEFDAIVSMDIDSNAVVTKTRCPGMKGKVEREPGPAFFDPLVEWLSGEKADMPEPKQAEEEPPFELQAQQEEPSTMLQRQRRDNIIAAIVSKESLEDIDEYAREQSDVVAELPKHFQEEIAAKAAEAREALG